LAGAAVIAVQAIRHLLAGGRVNQIGIGMVVIAIAAATNVVASTHLGRVGRSTASAALNADAAHLRTDALVSLGVLGSLIVVTLTGAEWVDSAVGLVVAAVITFTGMRILVGSGRRLIDETLPEDELVGLVEMFDR